MELKKQVVSLELAKELKEAGYPQEGLWWWEQDVDDGDGSDWGLESDKNRSKSLLTDMDIWLVAPTVA